MATRRPIDFREWASTGNKTDPGAAKYGQGWIVEIPELQTMNHIQAEITALQKHTLEEGIAVWDATTLYSIGGLSKASDNAIYQCNAISINQEPLANPAIWAPFGGGDYIKVFRADIDVTVGAGGDYPTINAALEALTEFQPIYKKGGVSARIILKTGFIIAEEIHIDQVDLSWISITSEQGHTPHIVNNAAIITPFDDIGMACVFGARNGGVAPGLNFSMRFDVPNSGVTKAGLFAKTGGSINIWRMDILDAGGPGISAHNGGVINARMTVDVSGSGSWGIICGTGSRVTVFEGITANNCVLDGIRVGHGGILSTNGDIIATGSTRNGMTAQHGGIIAAENIDVSGADRHGVEAIAANISCVNTLTASNAGDAGVLSILDATIVAEENIIATNCASIGIGGGGGSVSSKIMNGRKGAVNSPTDLIVLYGGILRMRNRIGGTNVVVGSMTTNGFINL